MFNQSEDGRVPEVRLRSRQFLYFLVFGGIAAATNLVVGAALYSSEQISARVPYWLAVAIGAGTGLLVNFGLNYRYNFRFRGRSAAAQLRTFCVVALIGIALTGLLSTLLRALFEGAGLDALMSRMQLPASSSFAAHVMAVALVAIYSYWAHKTFSFDVGLRARLGAFLVSTDRRP